MGCPKHKDHEDRRPRTIFFFTSISNDFGGKEMNEELTGYNDIDEVVIPNKRDVRGRRYKFVRFFNALN